MASSPNGNRRADMNSSSGGSSGGGSDSSSSSSGVPISRLTLAFGDARLERRYLREFAAARLSTDRATFVFSSVLLVAGRLRPSVRGGGALPVPRTSFSWLLPQLVCWLAIVHFLLGPAPPGPTARFAYFAMLRALRLSSHVKAWRGEGVAPDAAIMQVFDIVCAAPFNPLALQLPFRQFAVLQVVQNVVFAAYVLAPPTLLSSAVSALAAAVGMGPATASAAAAAAAGGQAQTWPPDAAQQLQQLQQQQQLDEGGVCEVLAACAGTLVCGRVQLVIKTASTALARLAGLIVLAPLQQVAGPAAACRALLSYWLLVPALLGPGAYLYVSELRSRIKFLRRCEDEQRAAAAAAAATDRAAPAATSAAAAGSSAVAGSAQQGPPPPPPPLLLMPRDEAWLRALTANCLYVLPVLCALLWYVAAAAVDLPNSLASNGTWAAAHFGGSSAGLGDGGSGGTIVAGGIAASGDAVGCGTESAAAAAAAAVQWAGGGASGDAEKVGNLAV